MTTITLRLGDSFQVLKTLKGVGAVVTDPPYLVGFMSRDWDAEGTGQENAAWHLEWLKACFDVLPSGGIIKVFSATRTFHRLAAAMEEAGFVLPVEGSLEAWGYGCLTEDTEILTPEGWAHYHRAKVGKQVLGFNPETGQLTWQSVEETFEYPYDREAYRLYGDGTDHIVSVGHRCLVQREGHWEFIRAEGLEATEVVPSVQWGVHPPQSVTTDVRTFLCEPDPSADQEAPGGTEGAVHCLHSVWHAEVVSRCVASEGGTPASLLSEVQRSASGSGLGEARAQGGCGGVSRRESICDQENDGAEQPGLEGWGDLLQEKGQLHQERTDPVLALPPRVPPDGPQGWVHHGTPTDRSSGVGSVSLSTGDGASLEPQPRGQQAGELGVVRLESGTQAVRGAWEALADLARVAVQVEKVHHTGTVWCVRVPTGAFVARRKGLTFITGNSGFPKYLNTSKAIDQHFGAEREVVGKVGNIDPQVVDRIALDYGGATGKAKNGLKDGYSLTAAATSEAAKFDGWATALKPGWEPFLVGIKP